MNILSKLLFSIGLILSASCTLAAPATINITPTNISPEGAGGTADTVTMYDGCNVTTQTVGLSLGQVIVGQTITIQGDTDNTYNICVRGTNVVGEGGFANVVQIGLPDIPANLRLEVNCSLDIGGKPNSCSVTILE